MGFKWATLVVINTIIYLFGFGAITQSPDIPKSILTICLILGINLITTMVITTYMTVYCITKRNCEVDDDDELSQFEQDIVAKVNNHQEITENILNQTIIQELSDAIDDDGETITIWYNQFQERFCLRCGNELLTSIVSVRDLLRLFASSRSEKLYPSFEDM